MVFTLLCIFFLFLFLLIFISFGKKSYSFFQDKNVESCETSGSIFVGNRIGSDECGKDESIKTCFQNAKNMCKNSDECVGVTMNSKARIYTLFKDESTKINFNPNWSTWEKKCDKKNVSDEPDLENSVNPPKDIFDGSDEVLTGKGNEIYEGLDFTSDWFEIVPHPKPNLTPDEEGDMRVSEEKAFEALFEKESSGSCDVQCSELNLGGDIGPFNTYCKKCETASDCISGLSDYACIEGRCRFKNRPNVVEGRQGKNEMDVIEHVQKVDTCSYL